MTHTLTPTADLATDTEDVARLVSPDGERIADPELDRWVADVDAAALRALYRDMVLLRRIDSEGVALQRQGQLALWPPCQGQEATQIGTARGLRADDFAFPSYRETGVVFARGAKPADYVLAWRGHHIFNPAAMGATVLTLLSLAWPDLGASSWWVGTPALAAPVILLGLAVLVRTEKLRVVAVFLVIAVGVAVFRTASQYQAAGLEVEALDLLWPVLWSSPFLFLGAFMLSEPLTLPPRRWQQLTVATVVGVLAGIVEAGDRRVGEVFDDGEGRRTRRQPRQRHRTEVLLEVADEGVTDPLPVQHTAGDHGATDRPVGRHPQEQAHVPDLAPVVEADGHGVHVDDRHLGAHALEAFRAEPPGPGLGPIGHEPGSLHPPGPLPGVIPPLPGCRGPRPARR